MSRQTLVVQDCDGHVDLAVVDHDNRVSVVMAMDLPAVIALQQQLTNIANDPNKNWEKPSSTIIGGDHG